MDVIALVLAILAIVAALSHPYWATRWRHLGWAIALLAGSWICQLVQLTGQNVKIN